MNFLMNFNFKTWVSKLENLTPFIIMKERPRGRALGLQINATNEIAIWTLKLGSDFFVNLAQTRMLTETESATKAKRRRRRRRLRGGGGTVLATNDDTNARCLCTLLC